MASKKKNPSKNKQEQETNKQPAHKKPSKDKKPERYHDVYEDDGNTHGVYESEEDYW